jgi:hypothetical protein
MRRGPFTIIDTGTVSEVDAVTSQETVWLSFNALHTALGWERRPEGLCRGDSCVPLDDDMDVISDGGVDLAAFAELLTRPLALDIQERIAYLGESVAEQSAILASLQAPDFTLPDLDGKLHSLSEQRGKKVLLVAYASW